MLCRILFLGNRFVSPQPISQTCRSRPANTERHARALEALTQPGSRFSWSPRFARSGSRLSPSLGTTPPCRLSRRSRSNQSTRLRAEGSTATFGLVATGTEPLSYQWRKNDVNIDGAIMPSYTTPPTMPADDGNTYSCVVSNVAGSVTSREAILSVERPAPTERWGTAADGTPLTWVVYAPSTPGPWPAVVIIHGGGFTDGAPTSSAESVTIGFDLADAGYLALSTLYRLAPPGMVPGQVSTGCAPQQYDDIKLAVQAARADPRCDGHVAVLGGSAGAAHAAWVALDRTKTITPPWSENDRPDAAILMSGPYDFLDYSPAKTLHGFARDVTSYCCVPYSLHPTEEDAAILMANSPTTIVDAKAKPIFMVSSEDDSVPPSQQIDLTAALDAAFGGLPKNYQSIVVAGTRHAFANWEAIISGTETVQDRALAFLAAAFGSPSPTPTPTATPTPTPGGPSITVQPANTTVNVGRQGRFSVIATGAPPLQYQWLKNMQPISGATKPTYKTPPTVPEDNGSLFSVVVSNSFGSVTSDSAKLIVHDRP